MVSSQTEFVTLERDNRSVNRTIMLVDDDPIFRCFASVILKNEGYSVIEAEHGLDGLQKLREKIPDLIICDISMPVLNGIEFAEEVSWEYPDIPMVVISATDSMSDVARALRFGVKDFLIKPISVPENLISTLSNIFEDEKKYLNTSRDFSCQWFRVEEGESIPEDDELHWHLNYLKENPNAGRDLLKALLPDRDTKQGKWRCTYNLLQSLESMPLVFDYAWLMEGQFAFYLVDSISDEEGCGIAASLLTRALFNNSLRTQGLNKANLVSFAENIERGIDCLDGISSVGALIGVADMTDGTVSILPAGLEAVWLEDSKTIHVESGARLGDGCIKNSLVEDLSILSSGKLNIVNIGESYFSLDIRPSF